MAVSDDRPRDRQVTLDVDRRWRARGARAQGSAVDLSRRVAGWVDATGIAAVGLNDRYPEADAEKAPDTRWIREASKRGEIILTRDGDVLDYFGVMVRESTD